MRLHSKRPAAVVALALSGALALAGCGGGGGDGSSGGAAESITMLPKNLGNPYFDASTAGARTAAEQLGVDLQEVGPQEASPDAQVQYINTAAQRGTDALTVSANDPTAICDALNQARDAGTAVVTFDSDTKADCRDLFVSQATAEGIATTLVDLVAEQVDDSGQIAVLSASPNATNQNTWIDLMKQELSANHPDIELVDVVYGNDDDQTSFDKTAALLQTHPDLKAIVSPTTVGISAAARYLSTSDSKGDVALTGLGRPNQMREYVENGTVESFALWNPTDLGYLATHAAKAVAEGSISGEQGETFQAGRLGQYTVGENGVVVLGDPFVFNADNIDDFDF